MPKLPRRPKLHPPPPTLGIGLTVPDGIGGVVIFSMHNQTTRMSFGTVSRVRKADTVAFASGRTELPTRRSQRQSFQRPAAPSSLPACQTLAATVPFPKRALFYWNIAMCLFHGALAVLTLTVGTLDLTVPVYATDLTFQVNNQTDDGPNFVIIPNYSETGRLPLTILTAVFFLLSCIAHGGNALLWRSFYERELERCRVTTRWVEYFLSAPVMILAIAYGAGIREYTLLLAIAMLVAATIPFGFLTEVLAEPASELSWVRSYPFRITPHLLGYIPQLAAWMIILFNLYDEGGNERAPDFVYIIIWTQLVLFCSFGIVQLVQQRYPPRAFYKGEIAYQWLSLISKGLLGGLLLVNVLVLGSFDEIYEQ